MTLLIRRADPTDAPAVVELMDEAATWLAPTGTTSWRPGQVDEHRVLTWMTAGRLYVAVDAEQVVGTVRVAWDDEPVWGPQPPDAGYVHALVVARTHAGRGLGQTLLNRAEQVVRLSGRAFVRLDHVVDNPRLERWYTDAGYAVVGRRDGFGADSVLLREKRIGGIS